MAAGRGGRRCPEPCRPEAWLREGHCLLPPWEAPGASAMPQISPTQPRMSPLDSDGHHGDTFP